jgi:hypothetical protein
MMHRILMLILGITQFAVLEAQIVVDSSIPLTGYNQKFALKLGKKKKLQSLTKISKEEAAEKAEALCHEKVTSQYITHQGQLLYYVLHTPTCIVKINALDGKKISLKKKLKEIKK